MNKYFNINKIICLTKILKKIYFYSTYRNIRRFLGADIINGEKKSLIEAVVN